MIWPTHRPTGVIHLSDRLDADTTDQRPRARRHRVGDPGRAGCQGPDPPQPAGHPAGALRGRGPARATGHWWAWASWPPWPGRLSAPRCWPWAGTGLAVHAAVAYPTYVVLFVALAFVTPSVMLWLSWQRDETRGRILTLAGVTGGLLLVAGVGASEIRTQLFGFAAVQSDHRGPVRQQHPVGVGRGRRPTADSRSLHGPAEGADTVGLLVRTQGEPERLVDTAEVVDGVATLRADALAGGQRCTPTGSRSTGPSTRCGWAECAPSRRRPPPR